MEKIFSIFLFYLFILVPNISHANSPTQDFVKKIQRDFPITSNGTTHISNSYGKIDIKTWANNRVKIDVTITVKARSESEAQTTFNSININFLNGQDFVRAETNINAAKSISWSNWLWNSVQVGSSPEFKIDYEVFLPTTNALNIANSYGDVFIPSMKNDVQADVKYGNIQISEAASKLSLTLSYGNANVQKAPNASYLIKYSNLNIINTQNVNIDSKYSRVDIETATNIKAFSKYDNYDINSVKEFWNDGMYDHINIAKVQNALVQGKYSDYSIGELSENGSFNLAYGSARVNLLGSNFSSLKIDAKYADFKAGISPKNHFNLTGVANYGDISYPEEMTVTYEKTRPTSTEIRGYVGRQDAKSIIQANMNYCSFKLRTNIKY